MSAQIIRANALCLPLADASVDLVVTSPPYFGLRSYQDGGSHYEGQIGAEPTPAEFVDALIAATREMVRVVKPTGSIWVNLGDKYNSAASNQQTGATLLATRGTPRAAGQEAATGGRTGTVAGVRPKSLIGIPWRYALRCIDDLGLILRAEVIWSKPNGLPESVTDRVRRSHEQWFHFSLNPRYYSAVDEIRTEHRSQPGREGQGALGGQKSLRPVGPGSGAYNPLGALPGSVWTIPTEPLRVPDHLGIDHFAAFPTEFPRRIITGWSPRGVCVGCGAGRRPVSGHTEAWANFRREHNMGDYTNRDSAGESGRHDTYEHGLSGAAIAAFGPKVEIKGYACDCPEPTAPTTPGVVLDPFGGTGTTALVADALGRHGISVDMSADYCRLATWRTTDPKQRAKAARREFTPPREQVDGQVPLFEDCMTP